MTTTVIRLRSHGDCDAIHPASGTSLATSKSPQFGGSGASFSSTDLLAVALGTCIATDIEPVAARHGIDLQAIEIFVDKRMSIQPKRIDAFDVTVVIHAPVDDPLLTRLRNAANACLVQRSLHPSIACAIQFRTASSPPLA
jgi:uncharacterized OsmC-like protein